jgi:hypothetical protein
MVGDIIDLRIARVIGTNILNFKSEFTNFLFGNKSQQPWQQSPPSQYSQAVRGESSSTLRIPSAYTALSVAAVFGYNQSRTLLWSWVVFAEEKIEKLWKRVVPYSHAGSIVQQSL